MFNTKKQLVLIKNPDNTTCYVIKHNNNIKPEILLEKEIIQKNNHENIVLNILEKSNDVPIENDIKIMSNDINNCVIETNNIIQYEEDIILRKNVVETPVVETPDIETPVVETPDIETKMSNLLEKMLNNIQIPETQNIQKNITKKLFNYEKIQKINKDQSSDKNLFNIEINDIIKCLKNNFNNDVAKIIDIYISNKKDIPKTLSEIFSTMITNKVKSLSIL
jgi:hypothetical protein